MTAKAHTELLKSEAVQQVVSAGNFVRYKDALNTSFRLRFIERRILMSKRNIQTWIKEQIDVCRHALAQDKACVD